MLGADVQTFLAVGPPRRQFAADGEPATPRRPRVRHRDRLLDVVRLGEELARRGVDPAEQIGVDAVPGDAEEPDVAAGLIDLPGDAFDVAATVDEWRHVDQREVGRGGHDC